jgi:hypothetical protein
VAILEAASARVVFEARATIPGLSKVGSAAVVALIELLAERTVEEIREWVEADPGATAFHIRYVVPARRWFRIFTIPEHKIDVRVRRRDVWPFLAKQVGGKDVAEVAE